MTALRCSRRLAYVLRRIKIELLFALGAAEVIRLPLVLGSSSGGSRFYVHAAHKIFHSCCALHCHLSFVRECRLDGRFDTRTLSKAFLESKGGPLLNEHRNPSTVRQAPSVACSQLHSRPGPDGPHAVAGGRRCSSSIRQGEEPCELEPIGVETQNRRRVDDGRRLVAAEGAGDKGDT